MDITEKTEAPVQVQNIKRHALSKLDEPRKDDDQNEMSLTHWCTSTRLQRLQTNRPT